MGLRGLIEMREELLEKLISTQNVTPFVPSSDRDNYEDLVERGWSLREIAEHEGITVHEVRVALGYDDYDKGEK